MEACQPVTFPNSVKHFIIRVLACAACGLATIFSTAFGQSPDSPESPKSPDRTCRRVESNSKGREIWMWSEPAVNLLDRPLGSARSSQTPQFSGAATWPRPGERSSGADQGDSDLPLSPLHVPVARFSAANGGGTWKDGENVPEGTAGKLLAPSAGKGDPAGQVVSPAQPADLRRRTGPDRQSEQSAGLFSIATGPLSLFSFLAGLLFCLLGLAVTLLFVLQRYAHRNGPILRVEVINARGASQGLQRQEHLDDSSASRRIDPAHAQTNRKAAACVPAKEQTLFRQVVDANIGLREQILGYEAGTA